MLGRGKEVRDVQGSMIGWACHMVDRLHGTLQKPQDPCAGQHVSQQTQQGEGVLLLRTASS